MRSRKTDIPALRSFSRVNIREFFALAIVYPKGQVERMIRKLVGKGKQEGPKRRNHKAIPYIIATSEIATRDCLIRIAGYASMKGSS